MAIMDLFYTDKCILMKATISQPNAYGVVEDCVEILYDEEFPCCLTPINTAKAREKYGVDSNSSFEISLDVFDGLNVHDVYGILYDGEVYIVQSFQQFSKFLILPESVTFLVRKRDF